MEMYYFMFTLNNLGIQKKCISCQNLLHHRLLFCVKYSVTFVKEKKSCLLQCLCAHKSCSMLLVVDHWGFLKEVWLDASEIKDVYCIVILYNLLEEKRAALIRGSSHSIFQFCN